LYGAIKDLPQYGGFVMPESSMLKGQEQNRQGGTGIASAGVFSGEGGEEQPQKPDF
jgi:hypothetical protein